MGFVIYTAVGVEGVAYGGNCSGNGDCVEANNVCTLTKCACSATSYKEDSNPTCATKIALGGKCTATPTGQCVDTNAECDATDSICSCTTSYFKNKKSVCVAQITTIDHTCDATQTADDQCSVDDTECRNDGTESKCLCKTTHYKNGAACAIRKKPEETCAAHQCVTHATCNTTANKCKCNAGYTATPTTTPTMCSGVMKVANLWYMMAVPIFVSIMSLLR
ncbi:Hypothetical predicted protein [Mytilus galloprovincialis]|uniref:EB domain-containing protein n=1 Tax=Mytilus galloprovincialis TaxID=29158 RepID=A0A8B6EY36_MYTGA|nr:Hypothetical predicted protein [Mytilus galloprovincialis]